MPQDLPVIRTCDGDVAKYCVKDAAQKQQDWAAGKLPGEGKSGAAGKAAAGLGVGQVRSEQPAAVGSRTDLKRPACSVRTASGLTARRSRVVLCWADLAQHVGCRPSWCRRFCLCRA